MASKVSTDQLVELLADEVVANKVPNPLVKADADKEMIRQQIRQGLESHLTRLGKGMKAILTRLDLLAKTQPELFTEQILTELAGKSGQSGKSVKESLGFSDATMQVVTMAAVDLYNHQEYQEARDAFFVLCELSPQNKDFWQSLGHANYFLHEYADALKAYEVSDRIAEGNPQTALYIARCYKELGQVMLAQETVQKALDIIKKNSAFQPLEEPAKAFLAELRLNR